MPRVTVATPEINFVPKACLASLGLRVLDRGRCYGSHM